MGKVAAVRSPPLPRWREAERRRSRCRMRLFFVMPIRQCRRLRTRRKWGKRENIETSERETYAPRPPPVVARTAAIRARAIPWRCPLPMTSAVDQRGRTAEGKTKTVHRRRATLHHHHHHPLCAPQCVWTRTVRVVVVTHSRHATM